MNVYAAGLLVSIIVYLVVGAYAGRKVRHLEDYFVAGRQAPTLLIVGTLVASLMSTNAFMGETGMAYAGNPGLLILLTAINCVGYVAGALYFGRFLRRSRALTVAEYFGRRFDSRRVQSVAGFTVVLGCTAYLVMVTQGTATIVHEVTGLSFRSTLLATWLGYTLFTLYSGSRGVILTDTMMFLLFSAVAFMGLAVVLDEAGGWLPAIRELSVFVEKPEILAWHGVVGSESNWSTPLDALIWSLILGVAWSIVVAVSPWQASRYLMARDEHTVLRSAIVTAGMVLFLYLVLMLCGAAINLLNPDIEPAQENMIWAAMNVMPVPVGVLMMSGIMAAGLSSASTFLSLSGFSISNDILGQRSGTENTRLRASRLAMLGIGLAALIVSFLLPEGRLFWVTYFAGTLFASSWGPVALMSVWSGRITEAAAFWGIIAGLAGNILTNLVLVIGLADLPVYLDPILVGVLTSYVVVEIVSLRGTVSATEKRRRKRMHLVPESELDPVKLARTVWWAGLVAASGLALFVLMVVFYVRPYRAATTGSATGELIFAFVCGACLVIAGALGWWGANRSYSVR